MLLCSKCFQMQLGVKHCSNYLKIKDFNLMPNLIWMIELCSEFDHGNWCMDLKIIEWCMIKNYETLRLKFKSLIDLNSVRNLMNAGEMFARRIQSLLVAWNACIHNFIRVKPFQYMRWYIHSFIHPCTNSFHAHSFTG